MGAIGRAEGEGGPRMSIINFGFRYRRAPPRGPIVPTKYQPQDVLWQCSYRDLHVPELITNGLTLPLPTLPQAPAYPIALPINIL